VIFRGSAMIRGDSGGKSRAIPRDDHTAAERRAARTPMQQDPMGGGSRPPLWQSEVAHPSTLEAPMQAGADQPQAPAAIRTGLGVIFVALELRRSTFLITALSPGGGSALSNSRRGRGCERGRPFRSSSSRKLAATDSGSILCSRRKQSKATPSIRLRSRHRAGAGGSGGKSSRPAMPRPSRQRRAKPSPSPWTMDPSTSAKRRAPRRPSASAGSRPNGWRNMRPSSTTSSAIGKP